MEFGDEVKCCYSKHLKCGREQEIWVEAWKWKNFEDGISENLKSFEENVIKTSRTLRRL